MSAWGPIGIGGDRASAYRTDYSSVRRTVVPNRPIDGMTVNAGPGSGALSLDEAREQIRAATDSFRAAFGAFTGGSRAANSTRVSFNPASTATLGGLSARVNPVADLRSLLQATQAVNTQVSSDRTSSAAIGLDLNSALSQLSSAALGLDITSPETASVLASSGTLGLDATNRASTITSTAEMNASQKSLSAYDLAFQNSTSHAQLSGSYSGSATSLTVKLTSMTDVAIGGLGALLSFKVLDQNNAEVGTYSGLVTAGQVIDIGDTGLKVRFTAGTLRMAKTATANVSQTGTDVSTSALFDAGWGSAPVFENFKQVTAGSFTINGTTIAVNANDSIDSVMSRINSSGAGVTASVTGDKIKLATNSASESDIVLANDTSGFLAATKLSGATTTRGNIRDDQQALAGTARFGGVTSGSFTINGVSISIDKDADSLTSVISKINSSGAGVTASYDSAQDKVVLTTTSNSEDLITVGGDTTGFLAAANLSTGNTVRGNIRDDQQVLSKTTQFGSVASGSFTINGVSISINRDTDSLSSIVSRINGAGAGVTASFNASTNKIELATTSASEDLIAVGNDTTGFLAVAGLSSVNTIRGNIADNGQALSATAAFAGVTSGSFKVNGVAISIDPTQDTLQTVITRINSAGAGVTASYDSATDTLSFTPDVADSPVAIEDDTSGFLAAANIASGVAGTRLNVDGAFNATGLDGPLFDPGLSVQAGSFTVNGTTITVAADDTVNTVLAKITASDAGVTATYDSATETVRLTSKQATADPIVVGNDTSGFLAAVKLDQSAQTTIGAPFVSSFDATLGQMVEYSGVQAGTITVNGQQIAVDPSTTTIRGLVSQLNSVPDLVATLDDATGAIRVSSTTSGGAITISDTSGVLSKLGIPSGTYNASFGGTTVIETTRTSATASNTSEVVKNVAAAVDQLNEALSNVGANDASQLRDEATAAIEDALEALQDAGIEGFTLSTDDLQQLNLSVDRNVLTRSLNKLGERPNAETAIGEALDGFSAHMARIAAAPASDENGRPVFANGHQVWARLTADQAITSLLYLRSTLEPLKAEASAARAAEAYATTKGILDQSDRATRFNLTDQIQAQLAATQVPLSFPQAPPPVQPSSSGVTKAAKADGGSRGLAERDRPTSLLDGLSAVTPKQKPREDADTSDRRGSDREVLGVRGRRGARRTLRGALRAITGRDR